MPSQQTISRREDLPPVENYATISRPSRTFEAFEDTTLDPAHPRAVESPVTELSGKVYQQILGLNPFETSYLGLFQSLDTKFHQCSAVAAVVFAIAAGLPLPLIGVIFGKLITSFPPEPDELRLRIGQLLGVAAAFFIVTAFYATLFGFTGERIATRARERLLECLLHLDQAYLDTHEVDVNSLLSEKVDTIHAGCCEKVGIFIQSISYFIAAFTVGFVLSPKLTGILLAAVLPTLSIITVLTSRYGSRYAKQVSEHSSAANAVVESSIRSVKIVQAFSMMQSLCGKHISHLALKTHASMRKAIIAALQVGAIYFLAYSMNSLAFYLGSKLAVAGKSGGESGTIFAVVFLILDSSLVVAQFAPFLEIFASAAAAYERIQELLDACPDRCGEWALRVDGIGSSANILELRDVRFSYPLRPETLALSNVSLDIGRGSFTALVGPSGGGKSTLVSLLTAAYNYEGSITFDGQQIRDSRKSTLRQSISVVEQDNVLFTGSIFDNISHGIRHLGVGVAEMDALVRQAAAEANLDFLAGFPDGIHTHLGHGIQLSGGQKQRVCLARALARHPKLLILDEPTAALDAHSEMEVMRAVKRAVKDGITVLMIAHRLSTVLDADQVVVFDHGKVVEQGTPAGLAAEQGVFRSLLDAQRMGDFNCEDDNVSEHLSETKPWKSEAISTPSGSAFGIEDADVKLTDELASHAIFGRCIDMIRPDAGLVAVGLFASMLSGGLLLGEAIIFGDLVQLLNAGPGQPDFQSRANFFCLMFLVVGCVGLVSWVTSGTCFGIASNRSISHIQSKLLRNILSLDLEWFAAPARSVNDLMSAFTKDSGDLSCLSGPALGTVFTTCTSVLGGIALALAVAWKIAVVLLAAVPVMLAAGFVRIRVLAKSDSRRRAAYRDATSLAVEACRNRRTVSVYGLEGYIMDRYSTALHQSNKDGRWFMVSSNVILAISLSITYFVYALAYWWGSEQVRSGMYSTKDFFTVIPAMLFSAQSAGQLFSLAPEIARAKAALVSISKLFAFRPTILGPCALDQPSAPHLPPDSLELISLDKGMDSPAAISFRDVSLSYAGIRGNAVLENVSFDVSRGQSVALVGPSGAGKSSALSLIERFYDVDGGGVQIDGVDVRALDIHQLRSRISLVSQEPDLLPGSIAYNIGLGSTTTVSNSDIEDVCRRCGLHDFIQSLPEGYNTDCGSANSSKLSGGQSQRLALARALIRKPEILLLDEPTSALDANSESLILDTLKQAGTDLTMVTVAHRLASIKDADRIIVMDAGRVVEQGTHKELVVAGGLYAGMAKAQSLA